MKNNLSSIYSTKKDEEMEGKWFNLSEDVSFKMRRMGGANGTKVAEIRARHFKPYARQIKNNTLDKKLQEKLFIRVFVESCMIDWKGLIDDNGSVEFNKDVAIDLFNDMPDLFDEVVALTDDIKNYQEELEDLGNS